MPEPVRSWTRPLVDGLTRYKTDRMWNINVNIVLADVVSTAATAGIIAALESRLPTRFWIVAVTAIVDGSISLGLLASLHTFANRDRGLKDLARLQVHRWILSPLRYLVGIGIQYALLAMGVGVGTGVLIAYWSAIAIVRTVHTLYGKRSGLFE